MAAKKTDPIEREINTLTRRIQRNHNKVIEIKKEADERIGEIERKITRDEVVLKALQAGG